MVCSSMKEDDDVDKSLELNCMQTVSIDQDVPPSVSSKKKREVFVEEGLDGCGCRNCKAFCENAERAWAMCADYGEKLALIRELQTENQQLRSINIERQTYLAIQQQKFQQIKNSLDQKDIAIAEMEDKQKGIEEQYSQVINVATEAQAAANQWREKYEESQRLVVDLEAKTKEAHQLNLSSMSVAATFSNKFDQEITKNKALERMNMELQKKYEEQKKKKKQIGSKDREITTVTGSSFSEAAPESTEEKEQNDWQMDDDVGVYCAPSTSFSCPSGDQHRKIGAPSLSSSSAQNTAEAMGAKVEETQNEFGEIKKRKARSPKKPAAVAVPVIPIEVVKSPKEIKKRKITKRVSFRDSSPTPPNGIPSIKQIMECSFFVEMRQHTLIDQIFASSLLLSSESKSSATTSSIQAIVERPVEEEEAAKKKEPQEIGINAGNEANHLPLQHIEKLGEKRKAEAAIVSVKRTALAAKEQEVQQKKRKRTSTPIKCARARALEVEESVEHPVVPEFRRTRSREAVDSNRKSQLEAQSSLPEDKEKAKSVDVEPVEAGTSNSSQNLVISEAEEEEAEKVAPTRRTRVSRVVKPMVESEKERQKAVENVPTPSEAAAEPVQENEEKTAKTTRTLRTRSSQLKAAASLKPGPAKEIEEESLIVQPRRSRVSRAMPKEPEWPVELVQSPKKWKGNSGLEEEDDEDLEQSLQIADDDEEEDDRQENEAGRSKAIQSTEKTVPADVVSLPKSTTTKLTPQLTAKVKLNTQLIEKVGTNETKTRRAPTRPAAPRKKPKQVGDLAPPPANKKQSKSAQTPPIVQPATVSSIKEKAMEILQATKPVQPKQAMLIDLPAKRRTRANAKADQKADRQVVPPKSSLNTLDSQLITSFHQAVKGGKQKPVAVKHNLFKANPDLAERVTSDKLAELMCRALQEIDVGDLWMTMKNRSFSDAPLEDMLLSRVEKSLFEFADELASEHQWKSLFLDFTLKFSVEVSKMISLASASVARFCSSFRCLAFARVQSTKLNQHNEAQSNELSSRVVSLLDAVLTSLSPSYVVPVFCYLITIDADLLVRNFFLVDRDSLRYKLLRLNFTDSVEFIAVARGLLSNRLNLKEPSLEMLSPVDAIELTNWISNMIVSAKQLQDGIQVINGKLTLSRALLKSVKDIVALFAPRFSIQVDHPAIIAPHFIELLDTLARATGEESRRIEPADDSSLALFTDMLTKPSSSKSSFEVELDMNESRTAANTVVILGRLFNSIAVKVRNPSGLEKVLEYMAEIKKYFKKLSNQPNKTPAKELLCFGVNDCLFINSIARE